MQLEGSEARPKMKFWSIGRDLCEQRAPSRFSMILLNVPIKEPRLKGTNQNRS